jgi:hypothetical protein
MGDVKLNPSFTLNLSAGILKIALLLPKPRFYPFIFCIVLRLAFDGLRYAHPFYYYANLNLQPAPKL